MERDKFVENLRKIVEIPTVSETGNIKENSEALDIIESWADKSLDKKRVKNGKAEILLLGNGNPMNPKVGYLVHVDVVNAEKEQFKMSEEDGKLYGRGVSDMKYSIPIGIELLNSLVKNKKIDMTVAITTDEEIGGGHGGNYLANELGFKPEILIVPDGGDGFVLVNKSKGVAHIQIESFGKPTHASRPWLGENAITPLIKVANELNNKYEINSKQQNWETTMNFGVFDGGKSTNQVCDYAYLKLDFRFPESRSVEEIYKEVESLSSKTNPNLKLKLLAQGDPTFTDTKNPEVIKFLKIASRTLGREIVIEGEEGASDSRHWAKYNIPIIMMKPDGGGIHSTKEWVDIKSCLTFYEILHQYISELTA